MEGVVAFDGSNGGNGVCKPDSDLWAVFDGSLRWFDDTGGCRRLSVVVSLLIVARWH